MNNISESDGIDLAFNNDKGYYDLSLDSNGDLLLTNTMETALFTSLLTNTRASSTEIKSSILRGGWLGDLFLSLTPLGSKLWLLSQAVLTGLTVSQAVNYTQIALQWLIDTEFADQVNVVGSIDDNKQLILNISIIKNGDTISESVFNLWQNTLKLIENV